jgi:hypothetical protein
MRRHRNFLVALAKTRKRNERNRVLGECSPAAIAFLIEILCNVLAKRIRVPPKCVKKLKFHSKKIRTIAALRNADAGRQALMKGGGFLSILLPPLVTYLAGRVIDHVVAKSR